MNTQVIAKNLVYLRQTQKLTQEDLAFKLHISRQAVSMWETGSSMPNLDILIKLSKLYNITINEIVEHPIGNHITEFEEIIKIEKSKLKSILACFNTLEIVKACMGASPTINELFKQLFLDIDFNKERIDIGSVRIDEIEDIHTRMIDKFNMEL